MNPERNCRFCNTKMINYGHRLEDWGQTTERISAYLYLCLPCHSEQAIQENGETSDYDFTVGKYQLCFSLLNQSLCIMYDLNRSGKIIARIHNCPTHLTPFNTTEKRIKTLILFS
jgi:hypothetical protein